MSRKSRTKGKVGEREACEVLRAVFPDARRRLGQERTAADNGRDLDGTAPFAIQVKRHQRVSYLDRLRALREAGDAVRNGPPSPYLYPVALCREDRGAWRVTCFLDTLIDAPGDLTADVRRLAYRFDAALVVEMDLDAFLAWWDNYLAATDSASPLFDLDVMNLHPADDSDANSELQLTIDGGCKGVTD